MNDESKMKSNQLKPNRPTTYLGVTSPINGDKITQTSIIKDKANKLSRKLNCYHIPH